MTDGDQKAGFRFGAASLVLLLLIPVFVALGYHWVMKYAGIGIPTPPEERAALAYCDRMIFLTGVGAAVDNVAGLLFGIIALVRRRESRRLTVTVTVLHALCALVLAWPVYCCIGG